MTNRYALKVRVEKLEVPAVLDRLAGWFQIDHPDGFLQCELLDSYVQIDVMPDHEVTQACVEFPAAEDENASFMASLAVQECGLAGREYRVVAR